MKLFKIIIDFTPLLLEYYVVDESEESARSKAVDRAQEKDHRINDNYVKEANCIAKENLLI